MIETLAKTGKKALTVSVVGATIAWTTGVAAFIPMMAGAATLTDGDLIKASGPAVYYYRGTDAKRCPFPNDKVFYSWFSDFKSVKTITDGELAAVGLCSTPMTYRSGTRLVKIATDPKVYAIEMPNALRHVADEATAKALFGDNWNKQIDDVADVFFGNYSASDKQVTTAMPPAGFVFKASDTSKLYYIDKDAAGVYSKREVSDLSAFKANGWMEKNIRNVAPQVLAGLAAGSAIAAMEKGLSTPQFAAAPAAGEKPADKPAVAGTLTVSLNASSPVAGTTLVTQAAAAGQLGAKLAVFDLMNAGGADLNLTSFKLKRLGVSADTTLSSVYLYEGAKRLSDSASVSSGIINFNSSAGLLTVKANSTKTIWVGGNIAAGTSGQTVGVGILEATSVATNPSATIAGTFPVNGNLLSIAQATLATVDFGAATPAASNIDPQNDYVMWQATATVGTRAVNLNRMTFREIGSGDYKDIKNFRLLVDGAAAGTPVAMLDADGYATFDLSAAPKKLETGGRVIKVLADIVGGTNRTFSISLRDVADSSFIDVDYNAAVTPTAAAAAFSARSAGDQTINAGSLTMTKASDSPSGNVVLTGSNVLLAKHTFTATGENMKIESLYVRVLVNGAAPANTTLRNGAVYANGVQVGSTTAITAAAAGTQFSLGSALIVEPGKPVTMEVKADIFNSGTGAALASGDTLLARIVSTANNVQRTKTGSYGQFPAADLDANTLTIRGGTLTLTKDQGYGNQNVVVPKQGVLLGQWTLNNAGSVEDITLNTLQVNFVMTDEFAPGDLTNVYVKYGTKNGSTKPTIPATTALTSDGNSWSISETIAKGGALMVQVYGDIASGAVVTETTADNVTPSLLVSGTTAQSTTAVSTNGAAVLAGQVTTARTAGILTVSVDSSSPVAAQSIAGTTSDGALKLKLSGVREDLYVKDITFRADTTGHQVALSSMSLWQSASVNGPWAQVGETRSFASSNTADMPGSVQWTLSNEQRVKVAKDSAVYLLVKPTYVSSQQTAVDANWMPAIFLSDLQAEGSTGTLPASGTGANLINASGVVIQANTSATYVDSTENNTAANTTAAATTLVTGNTLVFLPGDVIFIDEDNDATWDRATEELMVVLQDGGANLQVQRGAFGTTAVAYTADTVNIYRLSTATMATNAGLIGSTQTVVPNKLSLAISSTGYVHGSAQKVATLTATAGTNATDPGQNNITLTYVDLTVAKSTATINNVLLYPSQFDLSATYITNCVALSQTKWRCTLSAAGSTNSITEGSANVYNIYADVGYSNTGGSVEFSIANLGTGAGADVSWSAVNGDNTSVALTWVNQGVTQIKAGQQQTTAAVNDADGTAPTITDITLTDATADNALTVGATIRITFSERMDPATIGGFVPGAAAVNVTDAATGDISTVTDGAEDYIQLVGIMRIGLGNTTAVTANAAGAVSGALNSAGTQLTLTVIAGGALTLNAAEGVANSLDGTAATTLKDVNNNAATAAGSNAATVTALDF